MSIKINPQLFKKIHQFYTKNPKHDEQSLTNVIVQSNLLRLKKNDVKTGVKQFFKNLNEKDNISPNGKNTNQNENIKNNNNNNTIDLEEIKDFQSIRKKVKTTQNKLEVQFCFKDNPQMYKFQKLAGINKIRAQIQKAIFSPIKLQKKFEKLSNKPNQNRNKCFIINGTIGSGKTLVGSCILSYMKENFNYQAYYINSGSFVSMSNDAQQRMKKLFELAEQNQPSVLFFDDLQILCQKDSKSLSNASGKSAMNPMLFTFISCIYNATQSESKQIYLIASTSSLEKIDEKLRRFGLFQEILNIDPFLQQQRIQAITKIFERDNIKNSINKIQHAQILKEITNGYIVSDIASLIQLAIRYCVLRNQTSEKQEMFKINIDDLKQASKQIQPLLKKQGFANIPTTTLDDIGALEKLKQELKKEIIVPMKDKDKFKQINFQMNGGGVLLYGPPGCGKTMLAKAIANEAKANFIIVKGPQLLTKYVGESQQQVRKVFQRARNSSPCIIFFDQFDALAPKRQDQGNQVTQRVVNTLLNELGGVDDKKMVFVIAATNRHDIIDEAVLRSGRIQKHLYVPMPSQEQRQQILNTICLKLKKQQNIDYKKIAKKCQNFSGADLRYIVKQAVLKAVTQGTGLVSQQGMLKAIQVFQVNKSKRDLYKYGINNNKNNAQSQLHLLRQNGVSDMDQIEKQDQKFKFNYEDNEIKMKKKQSSNLNKQTLSMINEDKVKSNKKGKNAFNFQVNQQLINQFLSFILMKNKSNMNSFN